MMKQAQAQAERQQQLEALPMAADATKKMMEARQISEEQGGDISI